MDSVLIHLQNKVFEAFWVYPESPGAEILFPDLYNLFLKTVSSPIHPENFYPTSLSMEQKTSRFDNGEHTDPLRWFLPPAGPIEFLKTLFYPWMSRKT